MNEPKSSFWREPMAVLVAGLPLLSIVAGVGLVIIAIRAGGADVVTDRVQRVSQIQTTDLGPDERARLDRLSAVVRIDGAHVEVRPVTGEYAAQAPLQLTLLHPVRAAEDVRLELLPAEGGWRAEAAIDPGHDWNLQLAPADGRWRLLGRLPREQQAARLAPALARAP
ncbi:FixH family protein [Pseudoxanthomonas mexicana]|uniref:FixH family protein n=1 Tax=Pseudoxanthomonas mexicana TaxID=128785 RepID=UPI00398A7E99